MPQQGLAGVGQGPVLQGCGGGSEQEQGGGLAAGLTYKRASPGVRSKPGRPASAELRRSSGGAAHGQPQLRGAAQGGWSKEWAAGGERHQQRGHPPGKGTLS
jgi:hypothetical protein